jgi:hypothetical protein
VKDEKVKRISDLAKYYLFPLILLLFPLYNFDSGIDLTDTGFSLINFTLFAANEPTNSLFLNTYLSNALGFFFTKLPFGELMIGMKFYSTLLISALALLGYRFFITKMPAPLAFVGQLLAISLCWCPSVVLYNYLTYLLFLLGAIFLFRGLVGSGPLWLVGAGICLGINVFVRTPNILEAALIVCLWYYAWLRRKKIATVWRETLLCLAGYLGAVAVMSLMMMLHYGRKAPLEMIAGLFQMSESNEGYTLANMLWAILDAYLVGAKWIFIMLLCVIAGIPFFLIRLNIRLQKILYCLAIAFLFYALSRIGMYNFEYYQKFSNLQWAVIFLLLSLANMVWMLFSVSVDAHWKLIASLSIVVTLVTPLGSGNYVWPLINNLFFLAPVTLWWLYKFIFYKRGELLFPLQSMLAAILLAVIIQSLGLGLFYVYRDGEDGEKRHTRITEIAVLNGMRTTAANAANLQEINAFLQQYNNSSEAILFGDIPGLAYFLNLTPAISSPWPDLDTFASERFASELDAISTKPVIILNANLPDYSSVPVKIEHLTNYMTKHGYEEVFRNRQFIVCVSEQDG